ncbi:MAG TPA: putative porin [Terriglobales bacterium]|nr:putative porin [Terriglobales bacterium]
MKQVLVWLLIVSCAAPAASQPSGSTTKKRSTAKGAATAKAPAAKPPAVTAEDLRALREALAAQQQQILQLQQELRQHDAQWQQAQQAAQQAQAAANQAETKAAEVATAATEASSGMNQLKSDVADVKLNQTNAAVSTQEDQKRIGALEGLLGRFRFSGDMRVRGESFAQDNAVDRFRARIRARLGIDGKLGEDFTGGIYLATGAVVNGAPDFKDPVSTNETLTSFFERKTIGVDRGWITYNPAAHKWLSLTGGKWAYSWTRTPMTWDNDTNPEGFNEKISLELSNKVFKNFQAQAIQLLFNEVGGVQDSNAVGGSFQTRMQLGKRWTLIPVYNILNWNNADAIAQAASPSGAGVRIINANTFSNASRVTGTGSAAVTRFVSGFLYNEVILDNTITTKWSRYPVRILIDYLQNPRAKLNPLNPATVDKQDKAYWFEGTIGQQRLRNDLQFGYSFARIEQDAVISQFNESDMRAATNVLQHRVYFNWLLRPNTTVSYTLWIGRTLNTALQNAARAPGIGPGGTDPWLKRQQLDLIYRF